MIKIFGHYSPDTDATCAPIIWAWYLTNLENMPATGYILAEPNTEAQFVLKRWSIEMPDILPTLTSDDEIIVVDTNNPAELPSELADAQLLEIVDHHKFAGGIATKNPINITIRPLASTASVMASIMGDDMVKLPDNMKGLMLSCILSDTLAFRSPTTTEYDKQLAEQIANDLAVNIGDYAAEMFAAKSDVSHFSEAELIRLDSKIYPLQGKQCRVSVLETTTPESILERKTALLEAMPKIAEEDDVEEVLLFIVDILKEEATLLIPNDTVKIMVEAGFGVSVSDDTVTLPGVVSRKKQIVPAFS